MSLFWIDILGKTLFESVPFSGSVKKWIIPQYVSAVFECNDENTVLLALQEGLAFFDLGTGQLQWHIFLEQDITANRSNDGKCDAAGRVWLGTMDFDCKDHCGSLYRIDANKVATKMLSSVSISNGIAWSADNTKMYFIDSPTQKINVFRFNLASGDIAFERTAVHIPAGMGTPDGMCIDAAGMLWVAHWGGYGIYRWDPSNGQLLDKIALPCPHVTSCAFGNKEMDTLFITTAKQGLTEEQLKQYPLSGSVFMAKPLIKGITGSISLPTAFGC